jgi:hypothetical protein
MRRVDVDRMMSSISAYEYRQWEAYERVAGPIDDSYDRELLAQLIELLQVNNILTGASMAKKGRKNPAGKFRRVDRAHELFFPPDEVEDDEEPDEYEDLYDDDGDDYEEEEKQHEPKAGEYDPAKDPFADPAYKW